jgi:hypothetical protein
MYILKHDIPEIEAGAILEFNEDTDKYDIINLEDVARYTLTPHSHYTFIREVVESKPYWFAHIEDDENECGCGCDCCGRN